MFQVHLGIERQCCVLQNLIEWKHVYTFVDQENNVFCEKLLIVRANSGGSLNKSNELVPKLASF